jgi:hypothetical protein
MLAFAHDGRGTSTNVHRYLRDARSSSFPASKHNLFYFTSDLASFWTTSWSLPSAVTHLQSLTTGLCPGTQQLTYFRRLSINSLVALHSVCVIVSKIRAFLLKRTFTWTFLFSNARWLFDNLQLSKQSVSVTLHISLNIYWQLFCWNN